MHKQSKQDHCPAILRSLRNCGGEDCQSVIKKLVLPKAVIPTVAIRKSIRATVVWWCVPAADSVSVYSCYYIMIRSANILKGV